MKLWLSLVVPAVGLAVAAGAQKPAAAPPALTAEQTQFFESKIRPLLVGKCGACHIEGQARGGLALGTREAWQVGGKSGPAIVPGSPDRSVLLQRVKSAAAPMPPAGRLSDAEIADLETWIKMGAPDPRSAAALAHTGSKLTGLTDKSRGHWAFQPVRKPDIPKVANPVWSKNPIDAFVLTKLNAAGLKPNAPASRAALIRRAAYDLTGMPPTVEEVRAFLADRSPNAFEKVVDRLLASPAYGERWGRHWLDTARYSDTTGAPPSGQNRFDDFRYANAWTYRDWVIGAVNADLPYDQFLQRQVAADLLPETKDDPKQLAALGFLTVGKRFNDRNDQIDERIDTVTKATMAVTVACARCHDHKFDPIPTVDYYALHGIFNSIQEPEVGPEIPGTGDASRRAEYETQKKALLERGRIAYYDYVGEKLDAFDRDAAGYLMVALSGGGPRSQAATQTAERYGINLNNIRQRDNLRIVLGALRGNRNAPQILAPLTVLARLPEGNFPAQYAQTMGRVLGTPTAAATPARFGRRQNAPRLPAFPAVRINPILAQELAELRPRSLDDVAQAYGRVFAKAAEQRGRYLDARKLGEDGGVDPAMAQLIEFPLGLPPASAFDSPEKLRRLAERFRADLRSVGRFPFDALNQLQLTHPGAPGHAMTVEDVDEPADSRLLIRGERQRPGEVVPRRVFGLCTPGAPPAPIAEGSGRLELARALASRSNPLTARALVNRVWAHHFGQGVVRTLDDLGNMSEKPSHPELLDWLSARFMETGWSLKKLHKWILLSNAYQQGVETNPLGEKKDPQNRLLWRANLRRLDFESIRDTLVALTGKLDPTLGGKPVNITDEPYIYRRSVYGYIDRLFLSDLLTQFDVSDPTMSNSGRISTIVPQQALFFMNSPMAVDVARQVASRDEVVAAKTDASRVQALYLILFQRSPKAAEVEAGLAFMKKLEGVPLEPGQSATPSPGLARRRPMAMLNPQLRRGGKFAPVRNNTEMVDRRPLTGWELYVQALLCANEFVYVG